MDRTGQRLECGIEGSLWASSEKCNSFVCLLHFLGGAEWKGHGLLWDTAAGVWKTWEWSDLSGLQLLAVPRGCLFVWSCYYRSQSRQFSGHRTWTSGTVGHCSCAPVCVGMKWSLWAGGSGQCHAVPPQLSRCSPATLVPTTPRQSLEAITTKQPNTEKKVNCHILQHVQDTETTLTIVLSHMW